MDLFRRETRSSTLIPITLQPEPPRFAQDVRNPGSAFLRRVQNPNRDDWSRNNFWTRALADLYSSYGGICAYSASWIPAAVQASVDHFLPKSLYRPQAYEWRNFRLSSKEMNSNKGDAQGILDPCAIQAGWFVLRFDTLRIEAEGTLRQQQIQTIEHTIRVLKLNHDAYVESRFAIVRDYSKGDCTLAFLQRRYPFIASELQRQNKATTILGTIQ